MKLHKSRLRWPPSRSTSLYVGCKRVIDLLQHHEMIRVEDPDRIFAEGGSHEAVIAAKKAGKVRFIGFTGHKNPVHLRMLEVAKEHGFRFDAVQFPLNVIDAHFRSFERHVLPVLVKEEIGVLGMKPMGDGIILTSNTATPVECLHYTMSFPTSTVITGIDGLEILKQDLKTVKTFRPLTEKDVADLLARTAQAANRGEVRGIQNNGRVRWNGQEPELAGGSGQGPRRIKFCVQPALLYNFCDNLTELAQQMSFWVNAVQPRGIPTVLPVGHSPDLHKQQIQR